MLAETFRIVLYEHHMTHMTGRWPRLIVLSFALSGAPVAFALNPGDVVDDFRLTDHRGASHHLYYSSDMKAVVLMAQGNGCAPGRDAAVALEGLRAKYESQGVEFLLINSNLQNSREAIVQEAAQAGLKLPILVDETQLVGESLGLARNGEVLVVNPQGWKVAYKGAASVDGKDHVVGALDALLSGSKVATPGTIATGCPIDLIERSGRPRTRRSHTKRRSRRCF